VGLKPISVANWLPSVLWRCWLGHLTRKNRPEMTYKVSSGTHSLTGVILTHIPIKSQQFTTSSFWDSCYLCFAAMTFTLDLWPWDVAWILNKNLGCCWHAARCLYERICHMPPHNFVSIMYCQHLTPLTSRISSSCWVHIYFGKLEWLGYNLVKVAWWSTQSCGYSTSTWQSHRQPHCHSNSCPNALRWMAEMKLIGQATQKV